MRTNLVFVLQGYESKTEGGQLNDFVTVELFDISSEKALARAKKLIKKEFWRVSNIIEKEDGNNTK